MPEICPSYAQDMHEICQRYAQDRPKICPRYARMGGWYHTPRTVTAIRTLCCNAENSLNYWQLAKYVKQIKLIKLPTLWETLNRFFYKWSGSWPQKASASWNLKVFQWRKGFRVCASSPLLQRVYLALNRGAPGQCSHHITCNYSPVQNACSDSELRSC